MGRISIAAALAAILHALLLIMDDGWLKKNIIRASVREPIAVTLTYFTPQKKLSSPEKRPEIPQYKPTPPEKVPERPPQKQRPVKKVKKNVRVRKSKVSRKSEHLANKTDNNPSKPKEAIRTKNTPIQPVRPETKTPKVPKKIKPPVKKPDPRPPRPKEAFKPEIVPVQTVQNEPDVIFSEENLVVDDEAMRLSSVPVGGKIQKAPQPAPLPLKLAVPIYKKNPAPKYPRIARRKGYQGTVFIDVLVNREGRVKDARLLQSSGYSILDKAAMGSVKTWIFEPGMKGEERVELWVKVPVRFHLK